MSLGFLLRLGSESVAKVLEMAKTAKIPRQIFFVKSGLLLNDERINNISCVRSDLFHCLHRNHEALFFHFTLNIQF